MRIRWLIPLPVIALLVGTLTAVPGHAAGSASPGSTAPAGASASSAGAVPTLATSRFVAVTHNPDGTTGVTILDTGGGSHGQATFRAPGPTTDRRPDPTVAAGAVWWVDSAGVVWSLKPDAAPVQSLTLADVGANTLVSLAVSPGAGNLAAAVVTLPPPDAPPQQPAATRVVVVRNGAVTTVRWPDDADWYDHGILELVGFDVRGAVGVLDANPLGGGTTRGRPVQLDLGGNRQGTLGPAGCRLESLLPSGTTLCSSAYSLTVTAQTLGGDQLFSVPVSTDTSRVDELLSPDARRVAQDGRVWEGGQSTALPPAFRPQGWIDSSTLVGVIPDLTHPGALQLATVALARAGTAVPLAIQADALGTLGSDLTPDSVQPSSGSLTPPASPAPQSASPGLLTRLVTAPGFAAAASLALLVLAWIFRRRLDTVADRGVAVVRNLGPALRRRSRQLYHRLTDASPDASVDGTTHALRGDPGRAHRTIVPAIPQPQKQRSRLFAASLGGGNANAVMENPSSFDRFCITWMATSKIGRSYVTICTHEMPADTPWSSRLEAATFRLRDTPQFPLIAEELVGPWMHSEFSNVAEVSQFSSDQLHKLFAQVLLSSRGRVVR